MGSLFAQLTPDRDNRRSTSAPVSVACIPMIGHYPRLKTRASSVILDTREDVPISVLGVDQKYSLSCDLDNIFMPKSLEKQCTKNKAVNKDIDEWIDRTDSLG